MSSYGRQDVMLQDRCGEWWVATARGVLRYQKVARVEDLALTLPKARYGRRHGLGADRVDRLFEDRRGDIWAGAVDHIAKWTRASGRWEDLTPSVTEALGTNVGLQSFAEDRAGNIWMGFSPGGLARYRNGRWEAVRDGLPAGFIHSLLVDRQGRLWIASGLAGVARIDDPTAPSPRFSSYFRADRLQSDQIVDLAEDASGRIYVAGGRGVVCLDPATDTVLHLGAGAGPPAGETRALYCDRKGAIWFGSNAGLTRMVPAPDPSRPPAAPVIHEVRVSGVTVLTSDEGETRVQIPPFPAGKGSIEIGFGGVDFSVGNRLRYRHRLLPVETEWREPAARRSVHYARLGSGSYRFEVQAVGPTGRASTAAAAVGFRVDGPFWTSWWFLLLAGASTAALLYARHLYRLRHLLAVEKVRSHLAADLHDDLGAGLAEIAILAEVARQRDPSLDLDTVAQRARELRGAMSDLVWSVDPSDDNLEGLLNRWRQTAFTLLGDDRLEFIAPPSQETRKVSLAPDQRRQLLLLFKEIATNVARHAAARRVRVTIRHAPSWLDLEIRDDGRGFDPEGDYPGYGLRNIRRRTEALRGQLTILSRPGSGTIVRLRVPLASSRMSMQLSKPPEVA